MESCCGIAGDEVKNKVNEIIDSMTCWNSLEDEVLKLYCLFTKCCTQKYGSEELLNVNYIREKIFSLLIKKPISLDRSASKLYLEMKLGQMQWDEKND